MEKMIRTCDICERTVESSNDFFTIKVKSSSFINYINYDCWSANRKKFDICKNCIEHFKEFIKTRK